MKEKDIQIDTLAIKFIYFRLSITNIVNRNWIIKPDLVESYDISIKSQHTIYKFLEIFLHNTLILHTISLWIHRIAKEIFSRFEIIYNSCFDIVNKIRFSQDCRIFSCFELIHQNLFDRLLSVFCHFFCIKFE